MTQETPGSQTHVLPGFLGGPVRAQGGFVGQPQITQNTFVVPTVHNWVELVYRALGQTLPTGAQQVAFLGVREVAFRERSAVPDPNKPPEKAPVKGKAPPKEAAGDKLLRHETELGSNKVDIVAVDRTGSRTGGTTYNDLLFVVWTDNTANHVQHVEVFQCTFDAGGDETSTTGTAMQCEGKLYHAQPGAHKPSKYPGNDVALHLYTGTYGKTLIARDATKKTRVLNDIGSAMVEANVGQKVGKWEFCAVEQANSTIHVHFGGQDGGDAQVVGMWSTGCTVMHHSLASARYKRFMEIYRAASNKTALPYLLVSSKYVKMPTVWLQERLANPNPPPDKKSVIVQEGLTLVPGSTTKYLPSFTSKDFATAVQNLANNLDLAVTGNADALKAVETKVPVIAAAKGGNAARIKLMTERSANLRKALEEVSFTVSL